MYHLRARERAHALLARALAVRAELVAELGRDVLPSVEIRVAAVPAQMAALAPGELPAGAAAVAYRDLHLVVMSLAPLPAGPRRPRGPSAAPARPPGARRRHFRPRRPALVPRRLCAPRLRRRWRRQRAEALCGAALRDRLLRLRDIDAHFPDGPSSGSLAAAEAAELVRFLLDPGHRQRFASLIEGLREGKPFEAALSDAYEGDVWHMERRFRREIARRYSFMPVLVGATVVWIAVALGVMLRRRRHAGPRGAGRGQASSTEGFHQGAHARARGAPAAGGG